MAICFVGAWRCSMKEFLQNCRVRALLTLVSIKRRSAHCDANTGSSRDWLPFVTAALILSASITAGTAFAQTEARAAAERSSIVVRGKVLRTNASDEPLLAPSNQTAIISVDEMYAGNEIAGDQKGQTVTVILTQPNAVKPGEEALFFGNPRFLGKSLTIADEAELPASAAASASSAVQARRDRPVLERLAAANLVFRGMVESVRPIAGETAAAQGTRTKAPPSEHDPEWHVATVRIVTPLRGGAAGEIVNVVFAASRDITWFNSPKLKQGQDAVFIAHSPSKEEEPIYRSSGLDKFLGTETIYLVTEPFAVLPAADEGRIRRLLAAPKETK